MGILEDMRDLLVNIDANVTKIANGNGPTPPPNNKWPNLPEGFDIINQWDFSGDPAVAPNYPNPPYVDEPIEGSNGWRAIYNQKPGTVFAEGNGIYTGTPTGYTECIEDDNAPSSPKSIYRLTYPKGMREGNGCGTEYMYTGGGVRELFVGVWWKPSADFDLSNNGTKILFMFNGGGGAGGQAIIVLSSDRSIQVLPEYPDYYNSGNYYMMQPNVNRTLVTLGEWHQLEWYLNTDSGQTKWWLNGLLQGDHMGATNSYDFDMVQISSTYGGCCSHTRPYDCYYYFDQICVAVPKGKVSAVRLGKKMPKGYKLPGPDTRPWPMRSPI